MIFRVDQIQSDCAVVRRAQSGAHFPAAIVKHELARVEAIDDLRAALRHEDQRAAEQKHRSRHHPQAPVTALKFGLLVFQPTEPFA
jgi:hypothetical protein